MFDLKQFCKERRKLSPPHACPFAKCVKTFGTVQGIKSHIHNMHMTPERARPFFAEPRASTSSSSSQSPSLLHSSKLPDVYDVNIDDDVHKLDINETLEIVSDEEILNDPNGCKLLEPSSPVKSPKSSRNLRKSTMAAGSLFQLQPSVRPVKNYTPLTKFEMPLELIKYSERCLDEDIDYDMDLEDSAWLQLVNKYLKAEFGVENTSEDTFEGLIKCLEKEAYAQLKSSGQNADLLIDENAYCHICKDGDTDDVNAIIFCDNCNLPVHQQCYGVQFIPEGSWLCSKCIYSPSSSVDCVLCPNKDGAFKQTVDKRWAHVLCALWIPEVVFKDPHLLEPIALKKIPPARWKLQCYICKKRNAGACIQCKRPRCYKAFHVTCAQREGLVMEIQALPNIAEDSEVEKSAYCEGHRPDLHKTDRKSTSKMNYGEISNTRKTEAGPVAKRTKKVVTKNEIRTPEISAKRCLALARECGIETHIEFVNRLIEFWKLKRRNRHDLPLIRFYHQEENEKPAPKLTGTLQDLCAQRVILRKLRQDFEKVRLLMEMVVKREKLKRQMIDLKIKELEMRFQPLKVQLRSALPSFIQADDMKVFTQPVDVTIVKDYFKFIQKPMDLLSIEKKIERSDHGTFEDFAADINLMITNCLTYNQKDTFYYQYALVTKGKWTELLEKLKERLDSTPVCSPRVSESCVFEENYEFKDSQDQSEAAASSVSQLQAQHPEWNNCSVQLFRPTTSGKQTSPKTRKVQETKENSCGDSKQVQKYNTFDSLMLKTRVKKSFVLPRKAKFSEKSRSICNDTTYEHSLLKHTDNDTSLSRINRSKVNLLYKQNMNARDKLQSTSYKTKDIIRPMKKVSRSLAGKSSVHKIRFSSKRISVGGKKQGSCFKSSFRCKHGS